MCGDTAVVGNKLDNTNHGFVQKVDTTSTDPNIRNAQDTDIDIKLVKKWVTNRAIPPSKEISSESYYVKTLWSLFSHLEVFEGTLVRKWKYHYTKTCINQE